MGKHLIVELEAMLLERGKSSNDLARATGHTKVNVSRIRQAKMRGIRMDTLMEICLELDCQPGDILKIVTDEEFDRLVEERRKVGEVRIKTGLKRTAPERVYEIDLDLGNE
ncbi:helix-turn-helix domain-containing protein [Eggerthella timonensis]|uniref:helix-turn-helix domain-containing protein n=1 Tax=Eggerthella timonensis TaxID=1871008 RepID=UPI000C78F12F|nr:helix-turn-helix domain-containing protein [Eggerthella timonensis]